MKSPLLPSALLALALCPSLAAAVDRSPVRQAEPPDDCRHFVEYVEKQNTQTSCEELNAEARAEGFAKDKRNLPFAVYQKVYVSYCQGRTVMDPQEYARLLPKKGGLVGVLSLDPKVLSKAEHYPLAPFFGLLPENSKEMGAGLDRLSAASDKLFAVENGLPAPKNIASYTATLVKERGAFWTVLLKDILYDKHCLSKEPFKAKLCDKALAYGDCFKKVEAMTTQAILDLISGVPGQAAQGGAAAGKAVEQR